MSEAAVVRSTRSPAALLKGAALCGLVLVAVLPLVAATAPESRASSLLRLTAALYVLPFAVAALEEGRTEGIVVALAESAILSRALVLGPVALGVLFFERTGQTERSLVVTVMALCFTEGFVHALRVRAHYAVVYGAAFLVLLGLYLDAPLSRALMPLTFALLSAVLMLEKASDRLTRHGRYHEVALTEQAAVAACGLVFIFLVGGMTSGIHHAILLPESSETPEAEPGAWARLPDAEESASAIPGPAAPAVEQAQQGEPSRGSPAAPSRAAGTTPGRQLAPGAPLPSGQGIVTETATVIPEPGGALPPPATSAMPVQAPDATGGGGPRIATPAATRRPSAAPATSAQAAASAAEPATAHPAAPAGMAPERRASRTLTRAIQIGGLLALFALLVHLRRRRRPAAPAEDEEDSSRAAPMPVLETEQKEGALAGFLHRAPKDPRTRIVHFYNRVFDESRPLGLSDHLSADEFAARLGPLIPPVQFHVMLLARCFEQAKYSRMAIPPDLSEHAEEAARLILKELRRVAPRPAG